MTSAHPSCNKQSAQLDTHHLSPAPGENSDNDENEFSNPPDITHTSLHAATHSSIPASLKRKRVENVDGAVSSCFKACRGSTSDDVIPGTSNPERPSSGLFSDLTRLPVAETDDSVGETDDSMGAESDSIYALPPVYASMGIFVIVNIKTFDSNLGYGERLGSDVDAGHLKKRFEGLGFVVRYREDLTALEIQLLF